MRLPLLLLTLAPAFAQVVDLSTDFTGSNLVFWTRFRMQSESDATNQQKVYRWRDGQWSRLVVFEPTGGKIPGSIGGPFVAAGGSIYGWTEYPSQGFLFRSPGRTILHGATLPAGFPSEYFRISPNGRYIAGGTYGITNTWQAELLDTQTGVRSPWENVNLPAFADDGTLAYVWKTSRVTDLRVNFPGKRMQSFPLGGAGGDVAISPNAQWIGVGASGQLRVFSALTGESGSVVTATVDGLRTLWRISNTRVVYLSPDFTQLLSLDPATGTTTIIADSEELFTGFALSGDGNVAWAATETNRLWRYDLLAGTETEVLPPLGLGKLSIEGDSVRGSSMLLRGKYTKEQTVVVNGQPFPVSAVGDDGLWFQVPWEYRGPPSQPWDTLNVRSPGNPFENVFDFSGGKDFGPYFPTQDPSGAFTGQLGIAAHQDFRGVLAPEDPGRPGETIHVYMTGLGALEREVPTGVPAPTDIVRAVQTIVCTGGVAGSPAQTPLIVQPAIYAPGMIGFYQVDVTIPVDVPDGTWFLRCGDGASSQSITSLATRP